jgi:hypothetical protein
MQKNGTTHLKAYKVTNEEPENAGFAHFADCIGELGQEFQTRFLDMTT